MTETPNRRQHPSSSLSKLVAVVGVLAIIGAVLFVWVLRRDNAERVEADELIVDVGQYQSIHGRRRVDIQQVPNQERLQVHVANADDDRPSADATWEIDISQPWFYTFDGDENLWGYSIDIGPHCVTFGPDSSGFTELGVFGGWSGAPLHFIDALPPSGRELYTRWRESTSSEPMEPIAETGIEPTEPSSPTEEEASPAVSPREALAKLLLVADDREARQRVRNAILQSDAEGKGVAQILESKFDAARKALRGKPYNADEIENEIDKIAHGLAWLQRRPDDVIPVLVDQFNSSFGFDIEEAIESVTQYEEAAESAVEPLIRMLDSEYDDVQKLAVWALGRIGSPASSAIPKLLPRAGEFEYSFDDPIVVEALIRIGAKGPEVDAAMLELVRQGASTEANHNITIAAAGFLGESNISPNEAVPALVDAAPVTLSFDEAGVVPAAILKLDPDGSLYLPERLAAIGDSEASTVDEASQLVFKIAQLRQAAAPAIDELVRYAIEDSRVDIRQQATLALGWIGPEAIPAIKKVYAEGNPDYALDAIAMLRGQAHSEEQFVTEILRK
ncbi:MAG: hypothetical protein R3C05_26535 [Pirellulaceae bacterium]